MKAQGNLMVKEDNSRSGSKDMFSEDAEGYMFYLDFYHDNYCISESAIFKFELSETIYHGVDNLFKEFVHEKDLNVVNVLSFDDVTVKLIDNMIRCFESLEKQYPKNIEIK